MGMTNSQRRRKWLMAGLDEDVKKKVNLLIDIVLGIMRNMKKNVLSVVKDLIGIVRIITTITTKHILNV